MVLICAPLSSRAMQLSLFILTLATFMTPYQMWKGSGFKERVCWGGFMPLGISVWRFFGVLTIVKGVWAPFFDTIPSLPFNCVFSLKAFMSGTVMDKMFWATTVIAALLLYLGILYSPHQVHHKLFSNPLNSTGIISLFSLISPGILFLQMHQMHGWCFWGGAGCPWVSAGGRNW